jgi:hypothetical protein
MSNGFASNGFGCTTHTVGLFISDTCFFPGKLFNKLWHSKFTIYILNEGQGL